MKPTLSAVILFMAAISGHATPPPVPYGPVPTPRQVAHAEMGFYAFCHFGMSTFSGREWSDGADSENAFNPTQFNADQIVGAVKAAGLKGLILTCKHLDGFCLWPTKTTEYNIANSPYKNGHGDIVREISDACRRAGIEFGIYLSPLDRNNPTYGKPEYISVYREQMKELLTGYGPVFEVWMDGGGTADGYFRGKVGPRRYTGPMETRGINKSSYYDWPTTWAMIRKWQPGAVLFSDVGPDSRWCGNEAGASPDTTWATFTPHSRNGNDVPMPGNDKYWEGGSGQRDGKYWMQSEVDVSIRPGWFWHESENGGVRSPENLMQIYLNSVGHGTTFNLNCPPDTRGRLHENDVESLREFGEHLSETFATNLATGSTLAASNVRGGDTADYGPGKMLDGDPWSAWITDDNVTTPEVEVDLNAEKTFDIIKLREDIRLGQRVEGVAVDAFVDGSWKEIAKAESIGSCRLLRVPRVTTSKVRIRVTKAPVCPALSDFGLYLEPSFGPWIPPVGSLPEMAKKAGWRILGCSYEAPGGEAVHAIDGNPNTIWHTDGPDGERKLPQWFAVDMRTAKMIKGFTYLPRQEHTYHGMVDQYTFSVSNDGKEWTQVAEGEFGNLRANPVLQTVSFTAVKARYFKFTATHALEMNHAAVAEIGIVEAK